MTTPEPRFAFGDNWRDYSASRLDQGAFAAAQAHLAGLLADHPGPRGRFLDVGCGSGLFLAAARRLGFAEARGFDYDPQAVETARANLQRLLTPEEATGTAVEQGDALAETYQERLGTFDWVYAWGSLHHTGAMERAIRLTARRVAPGGILVLAIYNRSLTSPAWRWIKRLYVASPRPLRQAMVWGVFLLGALAKALYLRRNPFHKERGMNFYHDIVDWVGGYPYEYASVDEITRLGTALGLSLVAVKRGQTPIACNEFVFRNPTPSLADSPSAPQPLRSASNEWYRLVKIAILR